jgi:hypothetical protein
MEYTNADLKDFAYRSIAHGKDLTPWEENFLKSVLSQLENNTKLSQKQVEVLERIYANKTPLS